MLKLQDIAIGIKTFLRDEHLFNTIDAIRRNLPEMKMIIADCGDMTEEKDGIYADLERHGHKTISLPFDAGFGAMSNAIVDALDKPFLLVGSDDFEFSTLEVRLGIERLMGALIAAGADIASGRVNNTPYEFDLVEEDGVITEIPVTFVPPYRLWEFRRCDLTVNYSLIRKEVLHKVRWDTDVKIGGGEHAAFFIDCKRARFETVCVGGANINEQQIRNPQRYKQYRNRANSPERPCFVKRGITKYVLGDGRIDYEE